MLPTLDTTITRRDALATLGAGASALALAGCAGPAALAAKAAPVDEAGATALLDAMAERLLLLGPEGATGLGIDTGARAAMRGQLGDRSAAGVVKLRSVLADDIARVRALDTSALSHSTRTSLRVVDSAYSVGLDGLALPYGDVAVGGWRNTPYVVIQNVGAYLDIPRFLDSDHPVRDASDAEAYLSRLSAYADVLNGELGRLKDTAAQGVVAPAFLIDKATAQIAQSLKSAMAGGGLVESLVRRTREAGIAGDWDARASAIVKTKVAPALEAQLGELYTQRRRATTDAGMWARPGGDAFYAWALRASTTTRMTPDEVHDMGKEELKSLHARMDGLLKGLGYTQGTVGARMTALGEDPRFLFPDNDAGRAEIMAFIQKRLDFIRGKMPQAFGNPVRGNVEVRRLPPEEEPGAPGAYGGAGSIDGSIPGKMWINLRTTSLHNRYSLPTLVHHEAIPGHVWQGEYAQRLPLIRAMLAFNAYSEGWALYAEQLGDELGAYDGDPVGELGYLQSIAFRACRLVVDTGLHAKRWTREAAIDWFAMTNGSGREEVTSEVERYCSWPGQACGYKVGHSEINRQRARAAAALGSAYDVRAFNDTVVGGGNVPLDVLATNVDDYVAGVKKG
ncbi:MAG: hypothetical protein RLZZ58_962 [Pseudomonadota bacterium]